MLVDVLGAPYSAEKIQLTPDDEGEVIATLVFRPAPEPIGAVLQIHGYSDYFYQTVAADFWVAQGYDFYAIDLRKYGRSLLPGQTPAYVEQLDTYYEELDAALEIIAKRHDHIVVSAHSTGGLPRCGSKTSSHPLLVSSSTLPGSTWPIRCSCALRALR